MKKVTLISAAGILFILAFTMVVLIASLNYYEVSGRVRFAGLEEPVRIHRDDKGMAYVEAENALDAMRGQGFASAQDRLFQMEMTRRLASGRLSEVLGERGLATDKRMRTLGLARNARIHARLLNDETRELFEAYAAGVNAYIETQEDERPLELKLAGVDPEPWTIEDSLAILYLMGWNSAANIKHEIVGQALIDEVGYETASTIFPVNINPDEGDETAGPAEVEPEGGAAEAEAGAEEVGGEGAAEAGDAEAAATEVEGAGEAAGAEAPPGESAMPADGAGEGEEEGAAEAEGEDAAEAEGAAEDGSAAEGEGVEDEAAADEPSAAMTARRLEREIAGFLDDPLVRAILGDRGELKIGSNNWAVAASMSPNARPVVANDPHLDASMLPGPLYPTGLFCPEFRVVGAGVAGIPGMIIGRSQYVAAGATNAYGDAQDLYIESIDPENSNHYMEGETSVPFDVLHDVIRVRDRAAEGGYREVPFQVRLTHRGPIISGMVPGMAEDKVVSLRWAAYETMQPETGLEALIYAKDAYELRERLEDVTAIALNIVFGDTEGNIGWQTTGRVPIRAGEGGPLPVVVETAQDNWTGFIPYEEMPHIINPKRGWVGTANHLQTPPDYPYYYSSYMSPHFRYQRMKEVLSRPGGKTIEDHWALQRDIKNMMAERLAPIMAEALVANEETRELGERLAEWDYMDRPDAVAPTIFQLTYQRFAELTFQDELGEELTAQMLGSYYYWQERLREMVEQGDSEWFDIQGTPEVETRDELFVEAALDVSSRLSRRFSTRIDDWAWGRIHRMRYYHPLRPTGFGSGLLGGQSHPMGGSGETLYRAVYDFNDGYNAISSASLRMVADLGDPEKVVAVMPSGVSGRAFQKHLTDQVEAYLSGEMRYWWFSEEAIAEHTEATLTLEPTPGP